MGDDASLDEFLGDEAGEPAAETDSAEEPTAETHPVEEPSGESESDGDESASESESDGDQLEESVEPATTTYEFAPGGVECDSCGASVDRRWHQDGTLVCAACKDW